MRIVGLTLLLAACSFSPAGGDSADGSMPEDGQRIDAQLDARTADAPIAVDAGINRPLHADCDLFGDQCAPGLGCRYTERGSTGFSCESVGAGGPGESCAAGGEPSCGPTLGCFPGEHGLLVCMTFCDTSNPSARCAAGQQCYPAAGLPAAYPTTTGVCG